ncbi:MAG: cobalamin B12-binding domain-containing protein [Coprobacillaceae bacterium]
MDKHKLLGASIGNCVHVAGVAHFLDLAEDLGYETFFVGPAVKVDTVLELIQEHNIDMVSLGYRLTPENVVPIIEELREKSENLDKQPIWLFGGTSPVAKVVAKLGFFDKIFDGTEDIDDCISYLRNIKQDVHEERYESKLIPRIKQKKPYPLLRHHFGLPSFEETIMGVKAISESKVLDVISLGIDQNTQQFFFRPDERDESMDGAGGVPVKNKECFIELKEASKCGNFPLMRCYSGTADVLPLAEVLSNTIDNAWCAVPLFWYNELDGRGTRTLEESMKEAHTLIEWHAKRNIPVEINEPHHWGLRDAHDVISVVASYLSAYHAKKLGVKDYISQYMFNIPNALSFSMDLAKVLAQIEMTESLQDDTFTCYRETRAGLPFLSGDLFVAKGQLAASTMLQMSVHPDIIHVVGYSEAEHAATPEVIIESTKIVRGVIRSCLHGNADSTKDPVVENRTHELLNEARYLLGFIKDFYEDVSSDPLFDPAVLADCVRRGILDAPHIVKNETYKGILSTRVIDGKCVAYDVSTKKVLSEEQRIQKLRLAGLLNKGDSIC